VPIDLFQGVQVEVRTLVVPEGGELPSDEELAAMEAADAPPAPAEAEGPSEIEDLLDETPTPETETETEAQEAEAEPDWRADAEAALREE
jgi:hypothetical protein